MLNESNLRTDGFILLCNLNIQTSMVGEGMVVEKGDSWSLCIHSQEAAARWMLGLTFSFL